MDTETGETEERKLEHASGEAERFYRQMSGPALIAIESTGNCQWFVEMLAAVGHDERLDSSTNVGQCFLVLFGCLHCGLVERSNLLVQNSFYP